MQGPRPDILLPRDVWQLVFKYLSCQERLHERLVCRLFSNLDGEDSLLIETALPSKNATDSLILFLSRRSDLGAPSVDSKLTGVAAHLEAVLPRFLPPVLRCSCLQALDLTSLLLQPLEAALSLALVPQGLLTLQIQSGTSNVAG